MASLNLANGSLTADIPASSFGIAGGGEGITDTWVQPINLGWHLSRVDTWVGYAFVAPTGAFSPGSTSNNGSGYWGNNFASGTTFYATKNKATQMNLATNWEFHGTKRGTDIIPGQAFTMAADDETINIYYGAADCAIALVGASVRSLLDWLDTNGSCERRQRAQDL